jgi:hypothetical protein
LTARNVSWKSDGKLWPAHTPFFRRYFVNEKEREAQETRALFERVRRAWPASSVRQAIIDDIEVHVDFYIEQNNKDVAAEFRAILSAFLEDLVACDPVIGPMPELREVMSLKELTELRSNLFAREHFLANREAYEEKVKETLFDMLTGTIEEVAFTYADNALLQVQLGSFVADFNDILTRIIGSFANDTETGFHRSMREQLYLNICRIAKVDPEAEHKRPLPMPNDTKLAFEDALGYVAGTPFETLFITTLPLAIPDETFFSHMHIVGGSGAGKTQWLSTLIRYHLNDPAQPSLVVVDSQGDLIRTLSRLKEFDDDNRLIVISPKDIDYPPAINIFDVKSDRIDCYDRVTREQVVAGAIQTLDYLFSGILGADLTAKQGVFFRFLARLLLKVPEVKGRNATLLDMLELTDSIDEYMDVVQVLDPVQRKFFERDFSNKDFRPTKEQLRYRLNGILENPTLERLFTSERTKLDLFSELNRGAVILIDTAKDFLKDNSGNYGRIFIALVLQAIMERAALPEHRRRPTHLIIDEAHEYFDQNIDDLLTQVRKYKLGCVFAHQYLGQCSTQLRASLAANTAIKLASGVSMNDARALAPDMRSTAEFILSQPKLQFAAYVRGVTRSAMPLPVVPGALGRAAQIDDRAFARFVDRNRERVADVQEREAAFDVGAPDAKSPAEKSGRERSPSHDTEDPSQPSQW